MGDERRDRWQKHYEMVLATYRQQSDLYIKAYIAYLGVVGGAGAYYFREGTSESLRQALIGFVILTSIICLFGTVKGLLWVGEIERILRKIEKEIDSDLPPIPLGGGRMLGAVSTTGVFIILVSAVILAIGP